MTVDTLARLSERRLWRGVSRLLGPGCITAAALTTGSVAVALVVLGLVLAGADFAMTEVAGTRRRRERIRVRVEDLLDLARDLLWASGSKDVRVNVMAADGDLLRVAYRRGTYAPEEVSDPWQRGVGCAGKAYDNDRVVLGAESREVADAAAPILRTVDVDVEILLARPTITAEHIASVMSVPVRDRNRHVVAVINVDDRLSLPQSALVKPEVIRAFERLADRLADVLASEG